MTEETFVRFGPGVPLLPDQGTAVIRGERTQRWILPLTVLILVIAVLIYFLWGRDSGTVAVTGVRVRASSASITCGQVERLTAVLSTNGSAGAIDYEWVRSDGATSSDLAQAVNRGQRQASVVLEWNFEGYGSLDATATLRILSPKSTGSGTSSAASSYTAAFTYACAKP
jgi:hypothetical protein